MSEVIEDNGGLSSVEHEEALLRDPGWMHLVDVPAEVIRRFGIRSDGVKELLKLAVENFVFGHGGASDGENYAYVIADGQKQPFLSNITHIVSHRISNWNNATGQRAFWATPFSKDSPLYGRLVYGMERQDEVIRVFDWAACDVNWNNGTVKNWAGGRCNIEVFWDNAAGWAKLLIKLGIFQKAEKPPSKLGKDGFEHRPHPTPDALSKWYIKRESGWAGPYPNFDIDLRDARRDFQGNVRRKDLRLARNEATSPEWRKQGPRAALEKPWPFRA